MEIDASLMEIFLNEAQSYLTTLEDSQSDLKAKADAAHGMKGIAAMLEFSELSQEASVLEHQLRASDDSEMVSRVAQLRSRLEEIQAQAKKQFSKEAEPQSQPEPPPPPETKAGRQNLFSDDSLEAIDDSPGPAEGVEPAPGETLDDEVEDPEWDPETAQMLQSIFLEEAGEILDGIDKTLAGLTKDIDNADHVHSLFRLTHTLKGAAGTVGFGWVSKAAHAMENHFDAIRSGAVEMNRERLETLVSAADILHSMVEQAADTGSQKSLFNQLQQDLIRSSQARPARPVRPEEKAEVSPEPESG
jgi:chemotaxis protein histidine kinase CheA